MSETTLEHWGCKKAPKSEDNNDDIISIVLYKGQITQVICPYFEDKKSGCMSPTNERMKYKAAPLCYFARGILPTIYNGIIEQGEENQ